MTNLLILASFAIGGVQPTWQGAYPAPVISAYTGTGAMAPAIPAGGIRSRGALLGNLDRDGDERLGPQELPERLLRVFHKADLNNDGFLDAAEIELGRTRISQQARKLENLRLDRRRGELVGGGGRGGVRRLDRLERRMPEAVPAAASAMVNPYPSVPPAAPENPATAAGVPVPSASGPSTPSPTPASFPASPVPQGAAKGARGRGGEGGLPTAEQILANLDRNGDGLVDTGEAVDQLAENFARLDKDKSGGLDRDEIDRGLRLARLFGIKPKVDPRTYQRPASGSPRAN